MQFEFFGFLFNDFVSELIVKALLYGDLIEVIFAVVEIRDSFGVDLAHLLNVVHLLLLMLIEVVW